MVLDAENGRRRERARRYVALAAEAQAHHPEWWNSYATVRVWLWTHDAGGITAADVALATAIDA